MTYLITGGAGFIGSNTAEHLIRQGAKVRILDNFSSGKRENLKALPGDYELIEGDIRDAAIVRKAVDSVDYVIHLAAMPSVPKSIADPVESNEINIRGTLNVLEAARGAGVKKLVFASSAAIYGDSPELPKEEEMLPNPLSPYALQKLAGEYYCKIYWDLFKLPTVSLRYFNVYGPRQDPQGDYASVIPRFATMIDRGEDPIVYGDGEQSRDFIYIDDCVKANLMAATSETIVGGSFNAACGCRYTVNELLEALRKATGRSFKVQYVKPRPGDIVHSYASIDKLAKCGFKPDVEFYDGLRRTVEFFLTKK